MTNVQYKIINKMKELLKASENYDFVGDYPRDVEKTGNNAVSVLIRDGDEPIHNYKAGGSVQLEWEVFAYIYVEGKANQAKTASDAKFSVLTDILQSDMKLSFSCTYIESTGVEKGDYSEQTDKYDPGWYPQCTVQRINFYVKTEQPRRNA